MNENGAEVAMAEEFGLLLYEGGTVCDDNFNDNSANAICREMGHEGAVGWNDGFKWCIQNNYEIKLDDVNCPSRDWSDCSYNVTHNNCGHGEDVFMKCTGKTFLALHHQ